MIRTLSFLFVLLLFVDNPLRSQAPTAPRDLPKLISRAQEFWTAIASGRRLTALEYVRAQKKEFLLNSGGTPFVQPRIVGVDFASDTRHAFVRTAVKLVSKDAPSGQLEWVVTDSWVWENNNWFLDLQDPQTGANPFRYDLGFKNPAAQLDQLRSEAESRFRILESSIDVGTLTQGDQRRIAIRMAYSGDVPIRIDPALRTNELALEAGSTQSITANSNEFGLLLNTSAMDGPFLLVFPMKISYKGVAIDRIVSIRGNVFAPLTVTQTPSSFSNLPAQELRLTVRNNTTESISIVSASTDAVFEVVRLPKEIQGGREDSVLLRLRPDAKAEMGQRVSLNLGKPLFGRLLYDYQVRVSRTP